MSSGGSALSGADEQDQFIGLATAPVSLTNEKNVEQVVGAGQTTGTSMGHFNSIYCEVPNQPTMNTEDVCTLRDNATDTTVTCTIATGNKTCSTTGLSVAFNAGDLLDVKVTNGNNNVPISCAIGVSP